MNTFVSMEKVIQCPTCGGSSPSKSERCNFCGNYLLHLTIFEKTNEPIPAQAKKENAPVHYFRSLKLLYQIMITSGLLMAGTIYLFMFDEFSETEMVTVSPIWFLLIIFGTGGLFTEKALRLILDKEVSDFPSAVKKAAESFSPIVQIGVFLIFLVPFFVFGLTRFFSSPLIITTLMTLVWAAVLYIFLIGIFPSL
ncbi:MAG: hypothetical protein R3D00_18495 [Bacteroidia bacterium]